jgi:glycerol-3-phosphate dehydrogenase
MWDRSIEENIDLKHRHVIPMNRDTSRKNLLARNDPWDIAIIGGGATGVGTALDAASRGYSVCLVEQSDFGKGTSSRSTKLVHGGVRYLQQGNVSLVMEALKERGILRQNAPHLVRDLAFVVPNYTWWEAPFYGIGMKVYDLLAGKFGFGRSRVLSRDEVLKHIPTLSRDGLRGGVLYFDGQFDDSRLLINLVQTAEDLGAVLLNYARVSQLIHDDAEYITGFKFIDLETQREHSIVAKCVINATGAFCDSIRRLEDPQAAAMIAPSQGVHVVLDISFLPGDAAIMVPRTSDGRVMFAIPWHNRALLGTTDTPISEVSLEPVPLAAEIDFILETAGEYLARRPTRADILSTFAGIRPLVKSTEIAKTAALSREHTIDVGKSGLLTIAGGKWTTYRKMAEDCVDHAATLGMLPERACATKTLKIHGGDRAEVVSGDLDFYGSDAAKISSLIGGDPELARPLHKDLPIIAAQIIFAVREEMARTVDDVLSRRTRCLLLNARAAMEIAPDVAELMAKELGNDAGWAKSQAEEFIAIARNYLAPG